MGKINVLSFEVANLIAAGEVVDRPASAIKEMIENAIDAGARRITVEIQNGGITFMRISDDGCGMDVADMPLSIKRHATSKIRTAEDLDGICTLGFRGEALAAISAVSNLRIISKTKDSPLGAELVSEFGEIVEFTERGCSDGTTIIVENLFANVPARRKFLKKDVTETTAVCANVERIALSHPEIAFRLITDGQTKLETAGDGKLSNAIYSVFGRDFANRLLAVDGDFDGISVKGYIGRSDNVKGNRNYQNFYINKRYVKSRTASAALEQAFVSYLPSERFPVCVLFISLNPGRVDVNVHPAKLEVKFSNEKPVFEAIYYAVRQALEKNTSRPEMDLPKSQTRVSDAFVPVEREQSLKARQISMEMPVKPRQDDSEKKISVSQAPEIQTKAPVEMPAEAVAIKPSENDQKIPDKITPEDYVNNYMIYPDTPENKKLVEEIEKQEESFGDNSAENGTNLNPVAVVADTTKKISQVTSCTECDDATNDTASVVRDVYHVENNVPASSMQESPKKPVGITAIDYRIVGEVFNSYVLVELSEKMLIIDKHAAHERIIFEQLKQNMYAEEVPSQLLMLPVEIMLMTDEIAVIEEYRVEIEAIGFDFSTSRNTVSVSAIPIGIEQDAVPDMFAVMADRIKSGTGKIDITKNIVFEKALYQASCKAAIKAGREYAKGHIEWLVDKLMALPDITVCPHGRPVAMEMSKKNMDRQFERT